MQILTRKAKKSCNNNFASVSKTHVRALLWQVVWIIVILCCGCSSVRTFSSSAGAKCCCIFFKHITAVLPSLHWLPVPFGVHFVFKSLNGLAPSYLSELLHSPSAAPGWAEDTVEVQGGQGRAFLLSLPNYGTCCCSRSDRLLPWPFLNQLLRLLVFNPVWEVDFNLKISLPLFLLTLLMFSTLFSGCYFLTCFIIKVVLAFYFNVCSYTTYKLYFPV